jgi:hypothetical protein
MFFGHNFDFESYTIVGSIAAKLGNVYAQTARYNYGPVFLCIQGFWYSLASFFPFSRIVYRIFIIFTLTLADIGIAVYIYKKCGRSAAILFFLNPVSIIITGYHNQFDNIAVLIALFAMRYYNNDKHFNKNDILFVVFMALSLITKHIFIFFLFWLLVHKDLPLKKRIVYAGTPAILFLLSFIPFFRGMGKSGIIHNVFLYRSFNNFPLVHPVLKLLHIPIDPSLYILFFVLLVCIAGILQRNENMEKSMLFYTLCLVSFSSAVANQYIVIPLAALFILTKYAKYIYVFSMGIFLSFSGSGLHILEILTKIFKMLNRQDLITLVINPLIPFASFYVKISYSLACFILFVSIVKLMYCNMKHERRRT